MSSAGAAMADDASSCYDVEHTKRDEATLPSPASSSEDRRAAHEDETPFPPTWHMDLTGRLLHHELSGVSMRRSAFTASRAAEAEAIAIAKARGLEERESVLETLALTLDANAERLAREGARSSAEMEDMELRAARLREEAQHAQREEADRQAASRWLLREVGRCSEEERIRAEQIDQAQQVSKQREARALSAERSAKEREEAATRAEASVKHREDSVHCREQECLEREATLESKWAEVEAMARRASAEVEAAVAKAADIDARAHAVASADAAAKERASALAERAEALAVAREELERQASEIDRREREVERREHEVLKQETRSCEQKVAAESATAAAAAERVAAKREHEAAVAALEQQRELLAQDTRKKEAELEARLKEADQAAANMVLKHASIESGQAEIERARAGVVDANKEIEESRSDLERRQAELTVRERILSAKDADHASREAKLKATDAQLLSRLEAAEKRQAEALQDKESADAERDVAREALASQRLAHAAMEAELATLNKEARSVREREHSDLTMVQPWLADGCCDEDAEWESIDWLRSLARAASREQSLAHEAARTAKKAAVRLDSTPWELLPRQVRASLRASVALGDRIRQICVDLQGALVRRFLRLSSCNDDSLHAIEDSVLREAHAALRGVASQEVVRRRGLVEALFVAKYDAADARALAAIPQRPAPSHRDAPLFELRRNFFDSLKLRMPAAKARFAAAASRWSTPQFRQYLFDKLRRILDDDAASRLELAHATASSTTTAALGLFFDAARAENVVELRFDDDGDNGRYAPTAACIFDRPTDLVSFFYLIDRDPDSRCIGVANGFAQPPLHSADAAAATRADDDNDDDTCQHEIAILLDLYRQGLICDIRLRLRALEQPQRHIASLNFIAHVRSHEEILLPVWKDRCHRHNWLKDINFFERDQPPAYNLRRPFPQKFHYTHPSRGDLANSWPAPPDWVERSI